MYRAWMKCMQNFAGEFQGMRPCGKPWGNCKLDFQFGVKVGTELTVWWQVLVILNMEFVIISLIWLSIYNY